MRALPAGGPQSTPGARSALALTSGEPTPGDYRLPSSSPPPAMGASQATAVSATLDRLARARELIAAGGKEAEEQMASSPVRSLSPVFDRSASPSSPYGKSRGTIADKAALQAQ